MTEECGVVFVDEGVIISCREPLGHRGPHRGFDLSGDHGAIWSQAVQGQPEGEPGDR